MEWNGVCMGCVGASHNDGQNRNKRVKEMGMCWVGMPVVCRVIERIEIRRRKTPEGEDNRNRNGGSGE